MARPLAGEQASTVPNPSASVKEWPRLRKGCCGEPPTRPLLAQRSSLPRLRGEGHQVGAERLFLVFGFFFGLALTAADRGAEDVAEASAGFGGAELLHRLLLLIDLARLDRQRDAAGG